KTLDAEQPHGAKAHPPAEPISCKLHGVRHDVKERRAEHYASRKAQIQLEPAVRYLPQKWHAATKKGCGQDQDAVGGQPCKRAVHEVTRPARGNTLLYLQRYEL